MARPREVSDEQILETTRQMVYEHGVAVATSAIAAKLGVSSAALFHRFQTKKNLLIHALMPQAFHITIVDDERGPTQVLTDFARKALPLTDRAARSMVAMMGSKLFQDVLSSNDPPVIHVARALEEWVERAIEAGSVAEVNPQAFAFGFTGALMMRSVQNRFSGSPDTVQAREDFIEGLVSIHAQALQLS